jgi:hypothetical protein
MALPIVIEGLTGIKADVNDDNETLVALTQNEDNAGFALLACKMGSESDEGGVYVERLRASDFGRLAVGMDQFAWNHSFPGSALNTGLWASPTTTMTITVSGGFCALNAGASVANGAVARVTSYPMFPAFKTFADGVQMDVQFSQLPVANNVCEWGWVISTGTTAPTDGIFFRLNASGEFRCVVNTNGSEATSAALPFSTLVGVNTTKQFYFTISDSEIDFYINDEHVAGIDRPAAVGTMTGSQQCPMSFRNYNTGVTSSAQIMRVGYVNVSYGDMSSNKFWHYSQSGNGANSAQGQSGATLGTTAIFSNGATPTAAVPTNTTAALATGLGGIFLETDTLAVGTDGIVMSYQVPAGTASLPGRSLYIQSLRIETFVSTVLVSGGYVGMWGLTFGATAVSQATAEAATAKAPRRVGPFGLHSVAAAAAALTIVTPTSIQVDFETPIFCEQGSFIQLIRRKQSGTAPSSGVLTHVVTVNGYWE